MVATSTPFHPTHAVGPGVDGLGAKAEPRLYRE
jgi:hypothetical protein